MRRPLVAVCMLAVVLAGCARGDDPAKPIRTIEPRNTASSPSPKATASDSEACRLLTSKERASIAGESVDAVAPVATQKGGKQCRWVKKPSMPLPALEVVTSPAKEWVVLLPQLIDNTIASGRAEKRFTKRLQAAKRKVLRGADRLSASESCEMFSLLVRANGGKKGASDIALFQPSQTGQTVATVQICTKGVYTLLTYEEKRLTPSLPLADAMLRLVKIAQKRAITLW